MFSLETFHKEYETDLSALKIRGRNFGFFVPKTLDRFLDPENTFHDFPLWAKIWEASIVLADHLARIDAEPQKRFLEIGSGLGVAGIIASSFGHHVTMTEYNTDALNFAHANAENNLSSAESSLEITKLDWNKPQLEGSFDYIIGSEVIYKERAFEPILRLFKTFLKPDGEVVLAERVRKTALEFFRQMGDFFDIKAQKKILRSDEGEIRVMLCRMRFLNKMEPG
jgi:predicted nicotinamide N-methyase